jgi:hypothetical protein
VAWVLCGLWTLGCLADLTKSLEAANAIQQAAGAALVAAFLMVGYIGTRCIDFVLREIEGQDG